MGYTFLRVEYMGYTEYTVYTVYPVTFDVFNRFAPPYPPNSNFAEIVCQIVFYLCEIFLEKSAYTAQAYLLCGRHLGIFGLCKETSIRPNGLQTAGRISRLTRWRVQQRGCVGWMRI